jgi:hypothetical protein
LKDGELSSPNTVAAGTEAEWANLKIDPQLEGVITRGIGVVQRIIVRVRVPVQAVGIA